MGVTPLHEERCTIRKSVGFGFFAGGNIPLWRVSFYDRFMVIAFVLRDLIPYDEIGAWSINAISSQKGFIFISVVTAESQSSPYFQGTPKKSWSC
jgi:hypothetical protein